MTIFYNNIRTKLYIAILLFTFIFCLSFTALADADNETASETESTNTTHTMANNTFAFFFHPKELPTKANNTNDDTNNTNVTKNIVINVTIDLYNNTTIANKTFDVIVNVTNNSAKIEGLNSTINSTINMSVTNTTKEKEPSFLILPTFKYETSNIRFHEVAINGTDKNYGVGLLYLKKPYTVMLQGARSLLKYDYNSTYNTENVYGANKSDYLPNEIKTESVSLTAISNLSTMVLTYIETTTTAHYNPMLLNEYERKKFYKKARNISKNFHRYDNYNETNRYKYKSKNIVLMYIYKLSDVLSPNDKYFYTVGAFMGSQGTTRRTTGFPFASAGYNVTNTTTLTVGFDNWLGLQYHKDGFNLNTGLNSMNFERKFLQNDFSPFNVEMSYEPNEIISLYGTYAKRSDTTINVPLPKYDKEIAKNNIYTGDKYDMILRYTSYEGGVKINLSGIALSFSYASLENMNYFIPEDDKHPRTKIAQRNLGNADMYKFGVSFGM